MEEIIVEPSAPQRYGNEVLEIELRWYRGLYSSLNNVFKDVFLLKEEQV